MKLIYYTILVLLAIACANNSNVIANDTKTAKVTFSFDDELLSKGNLRLEVSLFSHFYITAIDLYDEKYRYAVEDKNIAFNIPLEQDISVIKVELFLDDVPVLFFLPASAYLIEPEDNLSFQLGKKITLGGVGNEKNIIRERIAGVNRRMTLGWLDYYIQSGDISMYYAVRNDFYNAMIASKVQLLDLKRQKISDNVYDYIKDECVYFTESMRINPMVSSVEPGAPYQQLLKEHVVLEFDASIRKRMGSAGKSYAYTNYLTDVFVAKYFMEKYIEDPESVPLIYLNEIYEEVIKFDLDDETKDKVTAFLFSRLGTKAINGEEVIEKALDRVVNTRIKSYLEDIKKRRYSNADVYPFRLEDVNGNIYTPESFRGKKIILDFWFDGCTGCALLHKELVKIEQQINDPSIMFISVNVDVNRERWHRGMASGKYTSEGGVNLRVIDPQPNMVSYYGFIAFPQVLVVDTQGKLVSYDPPRPINAEGRRGFIELLTKVD
ncbi:TlpA family protein disulfide reductase [Sphingobacterium alkalisoli]|uniref:TlpA family protein disulfide reductase n=1 Tax=Sphingobacterium alkalisoli TaxID=1874115 RepID=A0A4U0H795_9SPHI|nr:TlpA disulfide reductase family protein [Sphingobacterium alkalisoli]TJY67697.1 TlpA family protein disulfide reductase [Sphingobacterium alkalisoli]GGH11914.1 hypothetical protein GCM10011418_11130 [Sphingobacterium alkalisoli]